MQRLSEQKTLCQLRAQLEQKYCASGNHAVWPRPTPGAGAGCTTRAALTTDGKGTSVLFANIGVVPAQPRPTVADLIAGIPASAARAKAASAMPDRLMRAELPPLDAGPGDLAKIKQEVAADLAPYEAMHVLACLVIQGMFSRPEIYSELDDDSGAVIEYVASILLERPSPLPTVDPAPPPTMSSAIQRTLDRTRGITMQTILGAKRRETQAKTPLDAIAAGVEMHDAISRWPGYADQARALLTELATHEDVAAFLRSELGFDLREALELEDAVGRLLTDRFNAHGERTAEFVNQLEEQLDAHPDAFPEMLRVSSDEERTERGWWLLAQEQFSERLRDQLLITADELAAEAKTESEVAGAFLRAFSIGFGDTKGTTILTGRNLVRARPFVSDGQGRYLLTLTGNLLWGIRPVVEAAIKCDKNVFHTYETARSAYVEQQAAAHFHKALKTDQVWTNVWYWLDGVRYEVDVIAVVDDVCTVAEVKSGDMSEKAWRGRKAELRRDLQALLGKSSAQCGRLAAEVQAGRIPEFIDRTTQQPVSIPLQGVTRVEAVVVTLEALGFVGLLFPHLRAARFFGDEEPPWVVSLYDLGAVADCCAYTPQFTSYVRRRRTLDERVSFMDECDLWMLHLRETLDFSLVKGREVMVDGRSDDLNKVWMFGGRRPTMKLDKSSKRRLRELDRKRPQGFVTAGEAVIADVQRGRRPQVRTFG
jgi:hypothetical protein